MSPETLKYNEQQEPPHKEVCDCLAEEIDGCLPGAEIRYGMGIPSGFWTGIPLLDAASLN